MTFYFPPPPPSPHSSCAGCCFCGTASSLTCTCGGKRLGPQLPLPLIHQDRAAGVSEIVEQPTDVTKLTERWMAKAENFTLTHHDSGPLFIYIAFTHVHTATPNIPGLQ